MGSTLYGDNPLKYMEESSPETARKTGPIEVLTAAWKKVLHNDLAISPFIPTPTIRARNDAIYEHLQSGRIPREVWEFYHDDPDRLATYSREVLGLDGIPTTEVYHNNLKEEYKQYRETYDRLYSQAGFLGKAAGIVGEGAAYLMDPLRAIGFVNGVGPTASILRSIVTNFAIQAGAEGLAHASLYSWKTEMDDAYQPADSLYEILIAGAAGAGLPLIGKGVRLTVGQGKKILSHYASESQYVKDMVEALKVYPDDADLKGVLKAEEAIVKNIENPISPPPEEKLSTTKKKAKQVAAEKQFQEDLQRTAGVTPASDPATQVAPIEKTVETPTSAVEAGKVKEVKAMDNMVVQRIDVEGADLSVDRPQGLYTSPDAETSVHADVGSVKTTFTVNPESNILTLNESSVPSNVITIRKGAMGASSGIHALYTLVGEDEFNRLKSLPFKSLLREVEELYPEITWTRYTDKQDILEGLAGIVGRKKGYDAFYMESKSGKDDFTEFVALTKKAFKGTTDPATQVAPTPKGDFPQLTAEQYNKLSPLQKQVLEDDAAIKIIEECI